jgi:uncharacterized membrane protein
MSRIIRNQQTDPTGSTLPIIGKIKIGEKKVSSKGVEYPSAIDYFRISDDCKYKEMFKSVFGDKPRNLKVVFISDNINEVCHERFECWDKGRRWGFGDGLNFSIYDNSENVKKYIDVVKTENGKFVLKSDMQTDATGLMKGKKWDTMLTLRFVLPGLKGILGQWQFETKAAKVTIPSIIQAFDFVKERARTIVAIPFDLQIEMAKGYNPGEVRNYPVVRLIPNVSDESIQKVRDFLETGKKISEIATLMLTEREMKRLPSADSDVKEEPIQDAVIIETKPQQTLPL